MLVLISVLAAAALLLIISALLMGWGGMLTRLQRLGLAVAAMGLVLAAIPRFMGQPPGLGDIAMLLGFCLFLAATYLPRILEHIDGLDGVVDGRIGRPREPSA